ncbi:type IV secretion system protein [Cupriavidus sp. CuC1]|uniref:type IV secretion system protein n=1 Tax=Cupriavidus sp. CuC1 TaxID=3373131 RepID=UPI0037D11DD7
MNPLCVFFLRLLAVLTFLLAGAPPAAALAITQDSGETPPFIGYPLNAGKAQAGSDKCAAVPDYFAGMEKIGARFKVLDGLETSLIMKGKATADKLMIPARVIGGTLALIALLWGLAVAMGTARGTPVTVVIDVVVPAAVVALFLAYYAQFVDGLVSASKLIASAAESPWAAVLKLVGSMLNTLMGGLTSVVKGFTCSSFSLTTLGVILGSLVAIVLLLMATYVMIKALVDIIAVIFLGPFLAAVGAAVGPIFIAFGASSWTRPWISSWVGFLIQALLLNFFAALVLELMAAPFDELTKTMHFAAVAGQGGFTVALDALGILGISLIASRIFGQIPQIVSALLPGNLGVVTGDGGRGTPKAMKDAVEHTKKRAGAGLGAVGSAAGKLAMKIPAVRTAAAGASMLTNKLLGRGGRGGSGGGSSNGGQGSARPFKPVSTTSAQRAASRMAARRGK